VENVLIVVGVGGQLIEIGGVGVDPALRRTGARAVVDEHTGTV